MTRLVIFRCRACGDTFPVDEDITEPACPSCGATSLEVAGEPLL